jgi:hypothetical protein
MQMICFSIMRKKDGKAAIKPLPMAPPATAKEEKSAESPVLPDILKSQRV